MDLTINTLSSVSVDELVELYRQGYNLPINNNPQLLCSKCNKMKTQTMASTDSSSSLFITLLGIAVGAFVYYNLGKWESRKLGINI